MSGRFEGAVPLFRKEVLRLEKEVREKMAQLEKLEEANNLLRRKEKLLQVSCAVMNAWRMDAWRNVGCMAKFGMHTERASCMAHDGMLHAGLLTS